jgi:hypothetical protein
MPDRSETEQLQAAATSDRDAGPATGSRPVGRPTASGARAARPAPTWNLRTRVKIAVGSVAGTLLLWLLSITMRVQAPVMRKPSDGGPQLFALWHGDHFPVIYTYRNRHAYVVTSQSADGQILTNILHHFGYGCVRGSSTRGGLRALIGLARAVRAGSHAAIALDGPRGPRRQAKPGIVLLAKMTGHPIIPVGCALGRYWEFHSWDRFRIPRPFTRTVIFFGEPIHVPDDANDRAIEQMRQDLERTLADLQERAEQAVRT